MSAIEWRTYGYILIFLLVLLLLAGCAAKATRPDGTETLASIVAMEGATASSQECLEDAKVMWNEHMVRQANSLPAGVSELLIGMVLMNQAYIQKDALTDIIARCMNQIAVVAQAFNATDQQRASAVRSISLAGIAGGFTYLSINSIANAFSQGMANAGGEYIVAGPGARVVNQQDRDYTYDDGFEIFGGNRENSQGSTTPAGQAPGAVSSSGDGDVVGNNMNINFSSGKGTGSASTSIPNFSNDPVTGGTVETTNGGGITSQPVGE